MMKNLSSVVNIILAIIIVGLLIYIFQPKAVVPSTAYINSQTKALIQKYPYISKRVLNESENDLLLRFVDLRTQLRSAVAPYGDNFAFYFEYLPTGTSIGVNERNEFNPASLGKVPLAMAFFLNKEQGEVNLDTKVKIKPEYIDNKSGSLWQKGAGTEISFNDAITIMLEESDNTAARLLADYVTDKDFDDVYKGLDLPYPEENSGMITAKGFSSILKSLYFASVLNKDNSEKILSLLTKSSFNDKLAAGIGDKIAVAHKIGFWENGLYSDCGIVYVPQRPYLLCMFSKTDEATARTRMQQISKIVYQYINRASD